MDLMAEAFAMYFGHGCRNTIRSQLCFSFLIVQFIVLRMVPMLHILLDGLFSSTYVVPRRDTAINLAVTLNLFWTWYVWLSSPVEGHWALASLVVLCP